MHDQSRGPPRDFVAHMRRASLWIRISIAVALGGSLPARAATMFYLSDVELCALSSVVLVADVVSVLPDLAPGHTAVRTRVKLAAVEYVKAPAPPLPELEIVTTGGTAGGVETRRPGEPRFVKGERVLVFLAAAGEDHRVVGLTRGKYHVKPGDGGEPATVRLDLDGLTQLDPATGREIPADLIPASEGRVYLDDMVATLRQSLTR